MSDMPISDYALLSDCNAAALVSKDGSVDWLCFPRFDSPSIFARLLDHQAGFWKIAPKEAYTARRRYLEDALVLETTFTTQGGQMVITDALALGSGEREHNLGEDVPHTLVRRVECVSGKVTMRLEYAPRPEYGLIFPLLALADGGVISRGGSSVLALSSSVSLDIQESSVTASREVKEGEVLHFALQHRRTSEQPPEIWDSEKIDERIRDTITAWQSWSDIHQQYDGPWRDLVLHSGRVLQGLTYHPTGAIVAAPTTSLPETVGGARNWDYRFTWVRDASLTMEALWVAACPDEANRFFTFFAHAAPMQLRRGLGLQIMFGIEGEHDLSERELDHLDGWRRSRPVRVGNAAWKQRQLDVYGELMGAAYLFRDHLNDLDRAERDFLCDLADGAARDWRAKDSGIWEIRGPDRHYVHSKLMCWLALDRALQMADFLGIDEKRSAAWSSSRDEIRSTILKRGWNERLQAFTQTFESEELDASSLLIPIVDFLPADDPRVLATIEAIQERLTDQRGLVYRYCSADGLEGEEGTFLVCTFWLVQALAKAGRVDEASDVFEKAISYANDVQLLSEEVDSASGEALGNFPQAFSHIGLINAAWTISQAGKAGSALIGSN